MRVARAVWIAKFDMEALVSALLRYGTLLSIGFTGVGLLCRIGGAPQAAVDAHLQGNNLLQFMLADLHRVGSQEPAAVGLTHVGIAALLLTPYVRVLASTCYFAFVERSGRHAVLTGLVLATLTYILFLG